VRAQEAIADFAATLRELRISAGNPTFREMAGRSGAISHTTLHEATKGNRLPSWATTAEFVKACGADPAAYRERWEKANQVVRAAGAGKRAAAAGAAATRPPDGVRTPAEDRQTVDVAVGVRTSDAVGESSASVPSPSLPPDDSADDAQSAPPASGGRRRFRLTRPAAVALATTVVGVGAAVATVVAVDLGSGADEPDPKPSDNPSKAALPPADCPVQVRNPPPAPPTHKGDAAAFIADITLPDCTHVAAGKTVTKIWRLKNAGKVPWRGYALRRLDLPQRADQCQTISEVPIDDTKPGEMVDIRADITTPRKPGLCYVRFKMVDAAGRVAFPGNRPVNFQIIVE